MKKIDLVVGANYGDEGKGTIVARIAKENRDENIANVLTNGGPQRGHSVCFNNVVHVFRHFGSASFFDATTFFDRNFILNPMEFTREFKEIYSKCFVILPNAVRDSLCRWTTPWDMMYNQIMSRLDWKGTCGMGIWNTICRYKNMMGIPSFDEFCTSYTSDQRIEFLSRVRKYYEDLLFVNVPPDYEIAWKHQGTVEHFIDDCMFMYNHTDVNVAKEIKNYDHIIFENGQGLLLNDEGINDPEKTPSQTGSNSIYDFMQAYVPEYDKLDVHYVTRPYLTRHGSRTFRSEFVDGDMDEESETNKSNIWQGDLMKANLDIDFFKLTLEKDMKHLEHFPNTFYNLDITHCDEVNNINKFKRAFGREGIKLNTYGTRKV